MFFRDEFEFRATSYLLRTKRIQTWVILEVLNKCIEIRFQASSDEEDAAQSFDVIVSRAGKRRESEEEQPERPRKASIHLTHFQPMSHFYTP